LRSGKCAQAAPGKGFRDESKTLESGLNPEKWHKNRKKWPKTCGNRAFAVDKVREKTQGKRR
jgi:hypothetical protein